MAAWKLPQENTHAGKASSASSPAMIVWTLPADLILEIVARSYICTLVRGAAACKLLRCDILSPSFLRRVTRQGGIVPPCILAYLNTHDDKADPPPPPVSLVHPATPAAATFFNGNLSPYLSRFADDLLGEYYPVTSHGGLVLLHRCHLRSNLSNLCVYDPITGHRTFLSDPPELASDLIVCLQSCVSLTAADGIDCSFLLFVPHLGTRSNDYNTRTNKFHIATSSYVTWATVILSHNTSGFVLNQWFKMHCAAVVLHGGIIHWLMHIHGEIFTYNVSTMEQRMIKLPSHIINFKGQTYLGSYYSPGGTKHLRLLGADGFKISVWHQLPDGDWAPEAMTLDMEEKLPALEPTIITGRLGQSDFKCSGEGSSAVFLRVYLCGSLRFPRVLLTVLDLETK